MKTSLCIAGTCSPHNVDRTSGGGWPMSRRRRFTISGLSGGMPSRCRKCIVSRAQTAHPIASASRPPITSAPARPASSASSSSSSSSVSSAYGSFCRKSSSSWSSRMRPNACSIKSVTAPRPFGVEASLAVEVGWFGLGGEV
uniref:Uncharacterized protein n=1 Tax=Anopheles farauti TaxID=69004 RepID=A0A182Q1W4_9DIPT